MDNTTGFFLSLLFGFIPMFMYAGFVYWLDRYEKEPKILLGGVFTWGAVVAAGAAFVTNTILGTGVYLFTNSESLTAYTTGSLIAPVVEESLKGLAVFLVFVLFYREFDSLLDGIIYAAIVALGFAATENVFYIFVLGFGEGGYKALLGMAFVRIVLVGWQHPFYTAFIGIGLAITRLSRKIEIQIAAPLIGWCIAVLTHATHNFLVQFLSGPMEFFLGTSLDWIGWASIFVVILLAIRKERLMLSEQLLDEMHHGRITPRQYETARSTWAQGLARLSSLPAKRYRETSRFYQIAAELAHKKYQLNRMGEEGGNTPIIEQLRLELTRLSSVAHA
jgi:RsiW-degrading membrane proteinase PrsW (M82 family)